jgi:hypothetical protein
MNHFARHRAGRRRHPSFSGWREEHEITGSILSPSNIAA